MGRVPSARRSALVLAVALMAACDPSTNGAGSSARDAEASPNASIPARRLAGHDASTKDASPRSGAGLVMGPDGQFVVPVQDAAPPDPIPFEPNAVPPADELAPHDLTGVVLTARWRWRDVPKAVEAPHVNAEALAAASKATSLDWRLEVASTGRARALFDGIALPLPKGTLLQARADRYGSIVVWPNATHFRMVGLGALRATIGERRVDVTPLAAGKIQDKGTGKRLDLPTRVVELSSPVGGVRLELARVPEAGRGAPLACRWFAEMAGVHPSTRACAEPELVLAADFWWSEAGGVTFEVTSLERRTDLPPADFVVPPVGAAYEPSGLPAAEGVFFAREKLGELRRDSPSPAKPAGPDAPAEGLLALNQSDRLLYLLLDGVPVLAAPPWGQRYLLGLRPGRYGVQWRSFLGDMVEPAREIDLPARVIYGALDGGTAKPDGG